MFFLFQIVKRLRACLKKALIRQSVAVLSDLGVVNCSYRKYYNKSMSKCKLCLFFQYHRKDCSFHEGFNEMPALDKAFMRKIINQIVEPRVIAGKTGAAIVINLPAEAR